IITSGLGGMVKFRRTDTGSGLEDTGAAVFGRLTYSGGNYIVTYKKYSGGIETGATLTGTGSVSVEMLFQEVMQFAEIPANANTLYGTVTEISTSGSGGVSTI